MGKRSIEELIAALEEEQARQSTLRRVKLVNALGKLGDSRAVEPLSRVVLTDPSSEVRSMAVIALGQIGDPAGAPAVRREASSRDIGSQVWAIRVLGLLRDRESVPLLLERLRSTDRLMRINAADTLGEIGDRAATGPLIEALGDRYLRLSAAGALARLGDPQALEPVRLAHQSAGRLTRRRIGKALAKLEVASDAPKRDRDGALANSTGDLSNSERWVRIAELMASAIWNAITPKSKHQRLAETIDQGNRLISSRSSEKEALDFLEGAVREFPEDPNLRVSYASTLLAFRPEDVGKEAAKAVELCSDDPGILVRAGHLLGFAQRWDDARTCAARANEIVEPDFVLKAGLDNLNGILAAKDHEFERAEELFRSSTEEEQIHAIDLAKFLAWRNRDTEALAVIDEALKHVTYKDSLERLRSRIVEGRSLAD